MSFEDRLRTSLADDLDRLEVSPGSPATAQRAGDRLRRQRRGTTGLVAAAVLAVVATGVAVARSGDDDGRLDPAPATGTWTRLPDSPLSERTAGIAVWTGREAIFLGGQVDHLCPPTADCADAPIYARDGAAYDPATQTWRAMAPSPVPVAVHTRHAVLGDELVLIGDDGSWWTYDASDDKWRDLPAQPGAQPYPGPLSALEGKVYVLGKDGDVHVLDLHREAWSTLPPSPHQPRLDPDNVVATPEGIVVTGRESTAVQDGTVPMWAFAEVYDRGSWRRLERSDMVGGYEWHWTGGRLVAPDLDCVDGGEVNPYPACIPQGGILDPRTGVWSNLPDAPEAGTGGWSLSAADGPLMTTYGYVYDDAAGTWTRIPMPGGAPDQEVAAVWADREIIAFGGLDSQKGWDRDALSNKAWSWTP